MKRERPLQRLLRPVTGPASTSGVHAGYGGFDTDGVYINEGRLTAIARETVPVNLDEFDNHGLLGGGQIGFNWQVGSILFGLEGDISAVDWDNVMPDLQVPVEPVIMALDVDFPGDRARQGRLGPKQYALLPYWRCRFHGKRAQRQSGRV